MSKYFTLLIRSSEKGFKGTVVNRAKSSLHEGMLETTLSVPLNNYQNQSNRAKINKFLVAEDQVCESDHDEVPTL